MTNSKMKRAILAVAAVAMMGITMPACPGQQETKDQLASLDQKTQLMSKQMQMLDSEVKRMNDDSQKSQQILVQMANVINEQKTAITTLDSNMKILQSQVAAKSKAAPAKKGGKRK